MSFSSGLQEALASEAFNKLGQRGNRRALQVVAAAEDDSADGGHVNLVAELCHEPLGDVGEGGLFLSGDIPARAVRRDVQCHDVLVRASRDFDLD
ncbi:MAG: hypothetical protein LC808_08310 [Actinobacteria bacterium]|nr:hypothetical protein [Actinomycetota bacterium]